MYCHVTLCLTPALHPVHSLYVGASPSISHADTQVGSTFDLTYKLGRGAGVVKYQVHPKVCTVGRVSVRGKSLRHQSAAR